jgi:4'-phosphopantetheinyl transferase
VGMCWGRAVGVDVQENVAASTARRMAARYFRPDEAAWVDAGDPVARFGRLWTGKEACVKAAGVRLMDGVRWPLLSGNVVANRFVVREVAAPDGFHAAVARAGVGPYRIVRHDWVAVLHGAGRPSTPIP